MEELAEEFLKSKIGSYYHEYTFLSIKELRVVDVSTDGHLLQINFEYTEDWQETKYENRASIPVSCWEIMEFLFTKIQNK